MTLPIYKEFAEALPDALTDRQQLFSNNPALWFAYFYAHTVDEANAKQDESKGKWLQAFINTGATPVSNAAISRRNCGNADLLDAMYRQREKLAQRSGARSRLLQLTLQGRFVSGCGQDHPLENGFAWHPTLGVPWLPGAALKGLTRAYATHWLGRDAAQLLRCFGDPPPEPGTPAPAHSARRSGGICFFDLLPKASPTLEADVLTPHLGGWIASGGQISDVQSEWQNLPAPWHNPVPIPFLVTGGGQFYTLLQARPGFEDLLPKVAGWIEQALEIVGAGAKTGSGYGRFARDRAAEQKAQEAYQEELAAQQTAIANAQKAAAAAAQKKLDDAEKARKLALPLAEKMAELLTMLPAPEKERESELADRLTQGTLKTAREGYGLSETEFSAALWDLPGYREVAKRWRNEAKRKKLLNRFKPRWLDQDSGKR